MITPPSVQDWDAPVNDEILPLIDYIHTYAEAIQQYADFLLEMNVGDAELLQEHSQVMGEIAQEMLNARNLIQGNIAYINNKVYLRRIMDGVFPQITTSLFLVEAQAHTTPWMPWFGWWQPIPGALPGKQWYNDAPGEPQ